MPQIFIRLQGLNKAILGIDSVIKTSVIQKANNELSKKWHGIKLKVKIYLLILYTLL